MQQFFYRMHGKPYKALFSFFSGLQRPALVVPVHGVLPLVPFAAAQRIGFSTCVPVVMLHPDLAAGNGAFGLATG